MYCFMMQGMQPVGIRVMCPIAYELVSDLSALSSSTHAIVVTWVEDPSLVNRMVSGHKDQLAPVGFINSSLLQ